MNSARWLAFTCLYGSAFMLSACNAAGSPVSKMNAEEFFSTPALLEFAEAAAKGKTRKLDQLLKQGVGLNARGKDDMTPLLWTMLKKNKAGFRYLLEHGADPNVQISAGTNSGQSVMSFSALADDPEYLDLVLQHGGNPNLIDPKRGITPIFQSIHSYNVSNVRRLIAAGANLNFIGTRGQTPAIEAAIISQHEMVFYILKAGADPTIKDNLKATVIDWVTSDRIDPKSKVSEWRAKTLELLKAKGVEIPLNPSNARPSPTK